MSKHAFLKRISYTTTTGAGRYGTYKMAQAANGGAQHVAFTRILHRTQPDPLMVEVNVALFQHGASAVWQHCKIQSALGTITTLHVAGCTCIAWIQPAFTPHAYCCLRRAYTAKMQSALTLPACGLHLHCMDVVCTHTACIQSVLTVYDCRCQHSEQSP